MNRRVFATVMAGLLGLVVAAFLGYIALQLVSQPVGLSTIPPRAGDKLVGPRDGVTVPSTNASEPDNARLQIPTWGSSGDDHGDSHEGSRQGQQGDDHHDDGKSKSPDDDHDD